MSFVVAMASSPSSEVSVLARRIVEHVTALFFKSVRRDRLLNRKQGLEIDTWSRRLRLAVDEILGARVRGGRWVGAGRHPAAVVINSDDIKPTVDEGRAQAPSIVVVLIWVYYTSQIILMGAEITHSYAEHNGSLKRNGEVRPRDIREAARLTRRGLRPRSKPLR